MSTKALTQQQQSFCSRLTDTETYLAMELIQVHKLSLCASNTPRAISDSLHVVTTPVHRQTMWNFVKKGRLLACTSGL